MTLSAETKLRENEVSHLILVFQGYLFALAPSSGLVLDHCRQQTLSLISLCLRARSLHGSITGFRVTESAPVVTEQGPRVDGYGLRATGVFKPR